MIRLGALGDVVRTRPSVLALRRAYPEAHISWLVERKAADFLHTCDELDEVIEFPRERSSALLRAGRVFALARTLREVVRELRRRRFDLVLDFHSIAKSGLLSLATGAPERIAYAPPFAREFAHLFANRLVRLAPAKLNRYDRNAGLVEYLGLRAPAPESIPGKSSTSGEDAFVLIHPGSSEGTEYKRYRASGYAAFAAAIRAQRGIAVRVVAGRSEAEKRLANEIVRLAGGAAALAPSCADFGAFVASIGRASLFVGSDSGPLHIATSLGVPAIQLIGATDPIENEPRGAAPSRQLRVDLPCSPCRRGCAAATCMSLLPHEWIVDAANELMLAQDVTGSAPAAPSQALESVA